VFYGGKILTHEVNIYLSFGEVEEKYPAEAVFDDLEWKALLDFVQYSKDLQAIQLVSQGGPGKLNISYTQESGLSYSTELPPEDQVLSLLHRLRPFILQNEVTNYYRVSNILSRKFVDNSFRNFLKALRKYYSGAHMQAMVLIQSNDNLINSEETLIKWLNGHEYHKDSDKQAELDSLHRIFPLETSRAIFIMMLYDKVRAIFILANLINVISGEEGTFRCTLK